METQIDRGLESIMQAIFKLREEKGKEKEVLELIEKSINLGHGFLTKLFFERILTYQHMVMNGDKKALPKMEAATLVAQKYVKENNLQGWESRVYRFLGRLHDYQNKFSLAINDYKMAVKLAKFDPNPFVVLELNAFIPFSMIMSGNVGEGYKLAVKIFNAFKSTKLGKDLKKKDYFTWAVWRSGITIRTVNAMLDKKINFDKKAVNVWIKETEADLSKGDFSYRKAELENLKNKIGSIS